MKMDAHPALDFPKSINESGAQMTPLREKIATLARKFDGSIMTAFQSMDLDSTLNSLDDTLSDQEVYSLLTHFAAGKGPDIVISPVAPSKKLVKVHVSKDLQVTTSPAPFSES